MNQERRKRLDHAQRQASGYRLAALNREPRRVFAIQRDDSGKVVRVLDYGELPRQRARGLVNKLTRIFAQATALRPDQVEGNLNGPGGYASWGVPIVKVTTYNLMTGLPVE